MSYRIYKPDEIDFDKITYSKPVDYNRNISSIYISYDKNPLLVQLPGLFCADGIEKVNNRSISHELLLTLNSSSDAKTNSIKTFLENLDRKLIVDAKTKYSWGENAGKLTYKVIVRQSNNDNPLYDNGVLKIKFIKSNGFNTMVYNSNREVVPESHYHDTFNDNCYVSMILEFVSLWKNKSGVFGVYIRPHQVRVKYGLPPTNILPEYSFANRSSESSESPESILDSEREAHELTELKNIDGLDKVAQDDIHKVDLSEMDNQNAKYVINYDHEIIEPVPSQSHRDTTSESNSPKSPKLKSPKLKSSSIKTASESDSDLIYENDNREPDSVSSLDSIESPNSDLDDINDDSISSE